MITTTLSRKEAKQRSLPRYFTGKPCKHGCISERLTSTGQCIEHTKKYIKQYQQENKNYLLIKAKEWSKNNREKHLAKYKRYREKHLEKCKEKDKNYAINNKAIVNAKCAKRRAMKLNATPKWVDMKEIKLIYINCPEGLAVDHIVPLINDKVCGLHVPWNLQYLTKEENSSKGSKLICNP
jgi:hypothetical protein